MVIKTAGEIMNFRCKSTVDSVVVIGLPQTTLAGKENHDSIRRVAVIVHFK
jgi:hypothetical protein